MKIESYEQTYVPPKIGKTLMSYKMSNMCVQYTYVNITKAFFRVAEMLHNLKNSLSIYWVFISLTKDFFKDFFVRLVSMFLYISRILMYSISQLFA